jgi:hypothetical protein
MKIRIILVIAIFSLAPGITFAFTGIPFGGRIISAVPCTCSPHTRITFQTPRGVLSLDYSYGSQKFRNYNIPIGRKTLGFYSPGAACMDYSGTQCNPRTSPVTGIITPVVGSSLR